MMDDQLGPTDFYFVATWNEFLGIWLFIVTPVTYWDDEGYVSDASEADDIVVSFGLEREMESTYSISNPSIKASSVRKSLLKADFVENPDVELKNNPAAKILNV